MERAAAPTEANVTPDVMLKCGNCDVKGIVSIPNHCLVAVTTEDGRVHIYEYSSRGDPIHVFSGKTNGFKSLVHLCDDIMASVDNTGMVLTWGVATGAVLDKLKVYDSGCSAITKASATIILVGTPSGEIIILQHADGKNLIEKKRCKITSNPWISDIRAYKDMFVVFGDGNAQVWNLTQGQLIHTIVSKGSSPAAVSDDFIVICGWWDCQLYVHQVQDDFKLLKTIDLHRFQLTNDSDSIQDISFLNSDLVTVTTRRSGIFFVSVQSGQCIWHRKLKQSVQPVSLAVLSDGRVCVGGWQGYCAIFKPSQENHHNIAECLRRMHLYHDPSSLAGQTNREPIINLSLLWKRFEAMENRIKVQQSDIEKIKAENKQQEIAMGEMRMQYEERESEIEKMKMETEKLRVQNKEQENEIEMLKLQNKGQQSEIEKMQVLNKEQVIIIANVELSNLKQRGELKEKIAILEQQYEAQKDKIAELEQPSHKTRRL